MLGVGEMDCIGVIHAFWADGILSYAAARGVIKLIPKSGSLDLKELEIDHNVNTDLQNYQ